MPDAVAMPDESLTALRAHYESLRVALLAPEAPARRDALKADIIALYKSIEREMAELAALKEDTKGLVQQWKLLDEVHGLAVAAIGAPIPAPEPAPHPAMAEPALAAAAVDSEPAAPATPAVRDAREPEPEPKPEPAQEPAPTLAPSAALPPRQASAVPSANPSTHTAPAPADAPTRADHLNASTYLEKGWSLMSLGDHAGAEAALTRALELAPNDPHGESLLGWAQMLQDKHDDALLNFQKVLMRQPQNSLARINVGYICLKKKIFGEAIEHLSKAIRLDNDRKATLYAHYYLGLLYLEREMYEDAQNFLRKAIALGPNLIEAYYELGRAIFFAGDRDGALGAWRDGARQNKFNPWGKRCAELLQHVEGGGVPPRSS
ncbi:MAG: tetratricopeptide repeat protein [Gemmatimonadaceae bacterium]